MRVSPDIGAVVVQEDRDIASHANRALRGITAQCVPLLEKEKLQDAVVGEIALELARGFLDGCGLAAASSRGQELQASWL